MVLEVALWSTVVAIVLGVAAIWRVRTMLVGYTVRMVLEADESDVEITRSVVEDVDSMLKEMLK